MPVIRSAPAPLAGVDDVAAVFEQPITAEQAPAVAGLLEYATARLVRLRPRLLDDLASGAVDETLARFAVVNAVARVLRNPAGYVTQAAGGFSYSVAQVAASGLLTFTTAELSDCSPVGVAGNPKVVGVGTVKVTAPLAPPTYPATTQGPVTTVSGPWGWW